METSPGQQDKSKEGHGVNLEQAFLNGIYGFIVSASFLGCWVLMMMVAGLLARFFGGKDAEGDDDE